MSISLAVSSLQGFSPMKPPPWPVQPVWRGASCIRPSLSLMPQRVTIWRASALACSMSLSAPVVRVPWTTSSAARPPKVPVIFARR